MSAEKENSIKSSLSSASSLAAPTPAASANLLGVFPPIVKSTGSPQKMSLNIKTEPVGSATGNPRNKTALRPGFSLMDWIRLTKSGKDLSGTGGQILEVTPRELALHRTRKDAWMAINGVVYNVTAYMDFHPGGWDELMKGAGKDATKMFNEVHRWVNYESMLQACIVGKLTQAPILPSLPSLLQSKLSSSDTKNVAKSLSSSANSNISKHSVNRITPSDSPVFTLKAPQKVIPPIGTRAPTFNWHQTDTTLTISVYTRRPDISVENVISQVLDNQRLQILVSIHEDLRQEWIFQIAFILEDKISDTNPPKINVGSTSGKMEIIFQKQTGSEVRWSNLGTPLTGNNSFVTSSQFESQSFDEYRYWTLVSREPVTHDVDHYVFEPPKRMGLHFLVPVGHHVHLKMNIEGMDLVRSYTPTLANLDLDGYQKVMATSNPDCDRNLHFIVKHYEGGTITPQLKKMSIGSKILISNHTGIFSPNKLALTDKLIMIAAGTGFTPMAKVIQYFNFLTAKNPPNDKGEKKEAFLLFFNKTQNDIIWLEKLDRLTSENIRISENETRINVKIHHVLSQEPSWSGPQGHINTELLKEILPKDFEENSCRLVCICGPNQFTDIAQRMFKEDLKYDDEEIFLFQG